MLRGTRSVAFRVTREAMVGAQSPAPARQRVPRGMRRVAVQRLVQHVDGHPDQFRLLRQRRRASAGDQRLDVGAVQRCASRLLELLGRDRRADGGHGAVGPIEAAMCGERFADRLQHLASRMHEGEDDAIRLDPPSQPQLTCMVWSRFGLGA